MKTVDASIEIEASPERVWQVISDLESFARWNPFMTKAAGHLVVGDQLSITIAMLGEAGPGTMRRDSARPGDDIFVTGTLGDAVLMTFNHGRLVSHIAHVVPGRGELFPRLESGEADATLIPVHRFDAYRIQMRIAHGVVTMRTREGLDWTAKFGAIAAAHPGLIWTSVTGFGQGSVGTRVRAYDTVVQAASGVMALTGFPGRVKSGVLSGPTRPKPCGIPGCMAILRNVTVPKSCSAALTTSCSPPMLTPPVVTSRSESASASSIAARTAVLSSGTIG